MQLAKLHPFSYELLHVPMQTRLYHDLSEAASVSDRLALLSYGDSR